MNENFKIIEKSRNNIIDLLHLHEKFKKVLLLLSVLFLFIIIYEYKIKYYIYQKTTTENKYNFQIQTHQLANEIIDLVKNFQKQTSEKTAYKSELMSILSDITNICNKYLQQTNVSIDEILEAINRLYIFVHLPFIEKTKLIQNIQNELIKFYRINQIQEPFIIEYLPDIIIKIDSTEASITEPIRDIFNFKN